MSLNGVRPPTRVTSAVTELMLNILLPSDHTSNICLPYDRPYLNEVMS